LLHEQNAFHWAELIELSNALVGCKKFMLQDQVAETLADRSKRASEALQAALIRRDKMVWPRRMPEAPESSV
jgi:dihydroneopterin aldolase